MGSGEVDEINSEASRTNRKLAFILRQNRVQMDRRTKYLTKNMIDVSLIIENLFLKSIIFSIIWNCITKIRIKLMFLLLVQLDRLVRSGLVAHKDSKGRAGDKAREATLDRSDRLVRKETGIIYDFFFNHLYH